MGKDISLFHTFDSSLYITKYFGSDSSIIEFYKFDTTCWGHIKGYMYRDCMHREAPQRYLIDTFIIHWTPKGVPTGRNFRESAYGMQCD
jgi:hypothetical protein